MPPVIRSYKIKEAKRFSRLTYTLGRLLFYRGLIRKHSCIGKGSFFTGKMNLFEFLQEYGDNSMIIERLRNIGFLKLRLLSEGLVSFWASAKYKRQTVSDRLKCRIGDPPMQI